MNDPIRVELENSRLLSANEQRLSEELTKLSADTLKNLQDAMRQIITLATAIIGLQIALAKDRKFTSPISVSDLLFIISLVVLFIVVALSFVGQTAGRWTMPNLNEIQIYSKLKTDALKNSYRLYVIVCVGFALGLCLFITSVIIWMITKPA